MHSFVVPGPLLLNSTNKLAQSSEILEITILSCTTDHKPDLFSVTLSAPHNSLRRLIRKTRIVEVSNIVPGVC